MLGILGFENYKITCVIGAYPEERLLPQEIFLDLKVETDISACIKTDCLYQTVCYAALGDVCRKVAEKGRYQLLETYAHEALVALLNDFPINWGWMRVRKPLAATPGAFVMVELKLFKPGGEER